MSTFFASRMSAMLWPWRCRPSSRRSRSRAPSRPGRATRGRIRIRIRTTETAPGTVVTELGPRLVHDVTDAVLVGARHRRDDGVDVDVLLLGDVGDGRRAVAQLREQLLRGQVEALAAASISGEPGRVPWHWRPTCRSTRSQLRSSGTATRRRARHADQRTPDPPTPTAAATAMPRYQPTSLPSESPRNDPESSCSVTSLGSAWERVRNSLAKCLGNARFGLSGRRPLRVYTACAQVFGASMNR